MKTQLMESNDISCPKCGYSSKSNFGIPKLDLRSGSIRDMSEFTLDIEDVKGPTRTATYVHFVP